MRKPAKVFYLSEFTMRFLSEGDEFGRPVASGNNRVVVGSRFTKDLSDVDSGEVYIFK